MKALIGLCRGAYTARTAGVPPGPLAEVLARLRGAGPPADSLGDFLHAVASGAPVPEVPAGHREEITRVLEALVEAIEAQDQEEPGG